MTLEPFARLEVSQRTKPMRRHALFPRWCYATLDMVLDLHVLRLISSSLPVVLGLIALISLNNHITFSFSECRLALLTVSPLSILHPCYHALFSSFVRFAARGQCHSVSVGPGTRLLRHTVRRGWLQLVHSRPATQHPVAKHRKLYYSLTRVQI